MGLFNFGSGDKPEKRELKLGIGFQPQFKLTADDRFLEAHNQFGQRVFRVALADIDGVSVDEGGWGGSKLKITGKGNVLAEYKTTTSWAFKAQEFVMDEIGREKKKTDA